MTSRRRSAKRTFGEISKLPSGRFRARFTGPDLNRHSAPTTFVARIDAEAWLVAQERAISRGEWSPPVRQMAEAPQQRPPTLSEYSATVIGRRRLRPATLALYEKLLRLAITPTFGDRQPSEISVAEVTAWYRSMNATPTQQANAYGLLKSILKDAVEDGLIATNPCRVKAGGQKTRAREIEVLSVEQLTAYLAAVPEARRVPLLLAGWCGLRSGEVRALRVRDLDLDATLAAQLGATVAELQARIGHSTPNMAMRYQHVAADRDAQLAARMSQLATGNDWTPQSPPRARRPRESSRKREQSELPGMDD